MFCLAESTAKVNLQPKGKSQWKAEDWESLCPALHSAEPADFILCFNNMSVPFSSLFPSRPSWPITRVWSGLSLVSVAKVRKADSYSGVKILLCPCPVAVRWTMFSDTHLFIFSNFLCVRRCWFTDTDIRVLEENGVCHCTHTVESADGTGRTEATFQNTQLFSIRYQSRW